MSGPASMVFVPRGRVATADDAAFPRQRWADLSLDGGDDADAVCCGATVLRRGVRHRSMASTASTASADDSLTESGASSSDCCAPLVGQVWLLAQDPAGSRQVQRALEDAPSLEAQEALARELHGHVAKAMRCMHANYVLQKCIAVLQPGALQFIVDELMAREGLAISAARQRYGCRVVQQLLRKCPAEQTAELVEAVLQDASALACHTFGHFTVQLLLELGTEDQRYRLVRALERGMRTIGPSLAGGKVIFTALTCAAAEDRVWIARAVLRDPAVLVALSKAKQGSAAVALVLEILVGREREEALEALLPHVDALAASELGPAMVERLQASGLA